MAKKILYFTAGIVPTNDEATEIAAIRALAIQQYEVMVMNGLQSPNYGAGQPVGDYVAGTVPDSYLDEEDEPLYPEFDITNLPDPDSLPADQAIISDGETIDLGATTVTVSVADNVATAELTSTTKAVVSHGDVLNVTGGGTVTLTIVAGEITGVAYTAP